MLQDLPNIFPASTINALIGVNIVFIPAINVLIIVIIKFAIPLKTVKIPFLKSPFAICIIPSKICLTELKTPLNKVVIVSITPFNCL